MRGYVKRKTLSPGPEARNIFRHSGPPSVVVVLKLLAVFTWRRKGEFSVFGGSESSHKLMRIYVASSNTLDWPFRAFCADSVARNNRAFSFLTGASTVISRNARSISSVRTSLSTGLSIPARCRNAGPS